MENRPFLPLLNSTDLNLPFKPSTLLQIAVTNIRNRISRYLVILFGIALTSGLVVIIRGYTVVLDIVEDVQISKNILFYSTLVTVICLGLVAIAILSTIFLSITERTEEIGLYRICGANSRDIFVLFEVESLLIGGFGVLLGYVAGVILFLLDLTRTLTRTTVEDLLISYPAIITSLTESFFLLLPFILVVVVFASLVPIIHATRMEVNNTLRHHV